jgi:hypothetical protein
MSGYSSGRVIFPFASLDVKQALVTLNSENPYLPHVFAIAAGRSFGFDIRMASRRACGQANHSILVRAATDERADHSHAHDWTDSARGLWIFVRGSSEQTRVLSWQKPLVQAQSKPNRGRKD